MTQSRLCNGGETTWCARRGLAAIRRGESSVGQVVQIAGLYIRADIPQFLRVVALEAFKAVNLDNLPNGGFTKSDRR